MTTLRDRFDVAFTTDTPSSVSDTPDDRRITCADFFCGIGGFHIAAKNLGLEVVFACDIDEEARKAYEHNFGLRPMGDIVGLQTESVPHFDLLFAGFPCQPFSIIGRQQGFADPRGTLFFELLRFIEAKRPQGIVLENVKQLSTIQKKAVIKRILWDLRNLGYSADYRVLNALDFGLPQKRERTIIVATQTPFDEFPWPEKNVPIKPLSEILESNPRLESTLSPRQSAISAIKLTQQKLPQPSGTRTRPATYPATCGHAPFGLERLTTICWWTGIAD